MFSSIKGMDRVDRKEDAKIKLQFLAHEILLPNWRRNTPLPRIEEVLSFALVEGR